MANARRVKAGEAYVSIGADITALQKSLRIAQGKLNKWGKSLMAGGGFLTGLSAATLAPIGAAVKSFAEFGDQIAKTSRRTGVAADEIAGLGHVAKLTGSGVYALEKGLRTMGRSILDAELGLSTANDALEIMSLRFEDLKDKAPEKQLEILADRMKSIKDASTRSGVAMKFFGRAGAQLIPLFNLGSKGIRALSREFSELTGKIDYEAAERLTDNFERLRLGFQGVKNAIAQALIPELDKLIPRFTGMLIEIRKFITDNPKVVTGLYHIATAVGAIGAAMVALGATFIAASSPILAPLAAISVAALSILESMQVVDFGVNRILKSLYSDFTVFGKSLEDWNESLTLNLELLFVNALKNIAKVLAKAGNMIISIISKVGKSIADLVLAPLEKALKSAAALGLIDKKAAGAVSGARGSIQGFKPGTFDKFLKPFQDQVKKSADALAAFESRVRFEGRGKKSFSGAIGEMKDKIKGFLDATFKPATIPKTGQGPEAITPKVPAGGVTGFFAGSARFGEMLGGRSIEQRQLDEAKKTNNLLKAISESQNMKGVYA